MGIKIAFNGDENINCAGKGPEFTGAFLKNKERFWNTFKDASGTDVSLIDVLHDLGYDNNSIEKMTDQKTFNEILRGYWPKEESDNVDFGITFDEDGEFLLNFNCELGPEKKRCFFWKVYKYHVNANQITLRGWIDWCNELYQIQHGKPRPDGNRIFVNPNMETAIVKGRFWNKNRIEKWLDDHGYEWTMTVETKYQFHFNNPDEVILIDSDAELKARKTA